MLRVHGARLPGRLGDSEGLLEARSLRIADAGRAVGVEALREALVAPTWCMRLDELEDEAGLGRASHAVQDGLRERERGSTRD